jgi:hypothetical protein
MPVVTAIPLSRTNRFVCARTHRFAANTGRFRLSSHIARQSVTEMPKLFVTGAGAWGNAPARSRRTLFHALFAIGLTAIVPIAVRPESYATADEFAPDPKYHTTVIMGPVPCVASIPPAARACPRPQLAFTRATPAPANPTPAPARVFTKNGWEERPAASVDHAGIDWNGFVRFVRHFGTSY